MNHGKFEKNDVSALSEDVDVAVSETETPEVPAEQAPPKKKRKVSVGTIVFYSLYGVFVVGAVVAMYFGLFALRDWLVRYEASQPEKMCQEVYDTFFSQPDWAVLYRLANVSDTEYEGEDAYVAYMTEKMANATDPTLTCTETSAGLSGDHKYIIKLDNEKIATFTLTEGESTEENITVWELGTVEVFFTRTQSVTVEKLPEHTVYINGVALDDSFTVYSVSTNAEQYLPEDVHGYRLERQYIDGFLVAPEILVLDAFGREVTMTTDSETGILTPVLPSPEEITEEETSIALSAAEAYAKFAIRSITSSELRKYFDPNSQTYSDLVNTAAFMQSYTGYDFDDSITAVTEYCRYSDTLFSARVVMRMNVYASWGNTKVFEMDTTFFFTCNSAGTYLVTDMTNVSILQRVEQVRLTFIDGSQQLDSFMVDAASSSLTLPVVTAPEGKVFSGWAVQAEDENGDITMTIRFVPDENGYVTVSSETELEPMTLYAVFENEG